MNTIFGLNLFLHVCSEIHRALMGERNVGALLQNIETEIQKRDLNN